MKTTAIVCLLTVIMLLCLVYPRQADAQGLGLVNPVAVSFPMHGYEFVGGRVSGIYPGSKPAKMSVMVRSSGKHIVVGNLAKDKEPPILASSDQGKIPGGYVQVRALYRGIRRNRSDTQSSTKAVGMPGDLAKRVLLPAGDGVFKIKSPRIDTREKANPRPNIAAWSAADIFPYWREAKVTLALWQVANVLSLDGINGYIGAKLRDGRIDLALNYAALALRIPTGNDDGDEPNSGSSPQTESSGNIKPKFPQLPKPVKLIVGAILIVGSFGILYASLKRFDYLVAVGALFGFVPFALGALLLASAFGMF